MCSDLRRFCDLGMEGAVFELLRSKCNKLLYPSAADFNLNLCSCCQQCAQPILVKLSSFQAQLGALAGLGLSWADACAAPLLQSSTVYSRRLRVTPRLTTLNGRQRGRKQARTQKASSSLTSGARCQSTNRRNTSLCTALNILHDVWVIILVCPLETLRPVPRARRVLLP